MATEVGIASVEARVERALELKDKGLWVAVGRTAPWPDENQPPAEDETVTAIDTPIVYVVPQQLHLCKMVETGGDVTFDGTQYAFVADEDAYAEAARFIYVYVLLDPNVHPHANYRQHAVYSGLTPAAGHENDQWLAPANVSDDGRLQLHVNHTEKSFGPGETRQIELLLVP